MTSRWEEGKKAMPVGRWWLIPAALALLVLTHSASNASLASDFSSRFTVRFPNLTTSLLLAEAARATDFPATATTPGFVYVFNPELEVPERLPGSLGPVFLERADTIGRNNFSFGISYLEAKIDEFNGENAAKGLAVGGSGKGTIRGPGIVPGPIVFKAVTTFQSLAIPTDEWRFSATYGVTNNWDVNVFVPLVYTRLQASGRQVAVVNGAFQGRFDQELPSFDEGAFGIGDLLLRSKYHFATVYDVRMAAGLVLRIPTGNENDFHGLGDVTLQPEFIVSRSFGRQNVHANLGLEFNASNGQGSLARYGVGVTLQPLAWAALLVDVLGSSGLDSQTVSQQVDPSVTSVVTPPALPSTFSGHTLISTIPRTDVVELAVGLKFSLVGSAVAYLSAIVPLTHQGLQASVIPTGGLEYTF
jgi:hypothetical protein